MNKSPFSNRRVIAVLLMFSSFLVLVCFLLYTFGQPKFDLAATATKAKNTEVAGAVTEESLLITEQAEETLVSQFQTQTAVPTATATFTPTPVLANCSVSVNSGTRLFQGPSLGFDSVLADSEQVMVLAEAENIGWYKIVDSQNGFTWMQKKDYMQNDCKIASIALPFLMGWDINRAVILDENFLDINEWVYKPTDELITPIQSLGRDFQVLRIGKERKDTEVSLKKSFGNLSNFSLFTSFVWTRNGDFGVRFWSDGTAYYEVIITPACVMQIYDSGTLLIERQVDTQKKCFNADGSSPVANYYELVVQNNSVSFKLNEASPINYTLPSSYSGDAINLVTKKSIVDIEYIVLTTTR